MNEASWLAQIEHHISFGFILAVCGIFLKNHKVVHTSQGSPKRFMVGSMRTEAGAIHAR